MNISSKLVISVIASVLAFASLSSCSDNKSYTELLNQESKYVNNFLADHRVIATIPADTVFEIGEDAPYYQLDEEGKVFMQVIDPGYGPKVSENQMVYFRYMRYPLATYVSGEEMNADSGNENAGYEPAFFRYNNTTLTSTTQWGLGIQMPLKYLPLNSTVNVVIKAEYGVDQEMSYVQPYLYRMRYLPARN
ncbi:MAG: DUF4827 family protein [Muribaculaceae bacterium]|nr:DUF4827 family protein [Muribaculaceae bacterium]